jgi:putative ABC transport system permease protein
VLLQAIEKMKAKRNGVLIGEGLLKRLNKRVGDRITITSVNFKGIDLEVEVVDTFPPGTRYDLSAVMNNAYLAAAFDDYKAKNKGVAHPLADRTLGLVWLRVKTRDDFERLAAQIVNSPLYTNPAVKCETQASGISAFLEAYRDIFWAMRWLLAPAVLVTLSLVIANAISISVRERRMEIAVLKVLGFRPGHILGMVLGEALLIGALSGLFSAGTAYLLINNVFGGIPFPIAFFPSFRIPPDAVVWGFSVGTVTALAGSFIPAWAARSVRVADVFSKIA